MAEEKKETAKTSSGSGSKTKTSTTQSKTQTAKKTTSPAKSSTQNKTSSGAKKTTSTQTKKPSTKSGSTASGQAKKTVRKTANKSVNSVTNDILSSVRIGDTSLGSNKTVKKVVRKIPLAFKIAGIILFVLGLVLGAFVGKAVCSNDTFMLKEKYISMNVGDSGVYTDSGVKIVSFGIDFSSKVSIETSDGLVSNNDGTFTVEDMTKEGTYYIIYTARDPKFSGIQKVKYIYVTELNEQGESFDESELEDLTENLTFGGDYAQE